MSNLNERLKTLRLKNGLSQIELSSKINIPRTTLSSWELGRRLPDLSMLIILADFYNVSLDYLAGRVDFMQTKPVILENDNANESMFEDDLVNKLIPKLCNNLEMREICRELLNLTDSALAQLLRIVKVIEKPKD